MKLAAAFAVIFTFFLFPKAAEAGRVVGNGSNVVKCPKDSGKDEYELLDLFESRELYDQKLDFGGPKLSEKERLELVFKKLEKIAPVRARFYREKSKNFIDEAEFKPNWKFRETSDSFQVGVPAGCSLQQMAIQMQPKLPYDKRYYLDKVIWEGLDSIQRAAIILHEIIYRDAISLGQEDSTSTRRLVGILTSSKLSNLTVSEFTQIINRLGFENIEATTTNLVTFSDIDSGDAWVKKGVVIKPGELIVDDASEGPHEIYQVDIPIVAGQWYTASIFAKRTPLRGPKILSLTIGTETGVSYVNFDLSKGDVVYNTSNGTSREAVGWIQKWPGGWYRCALSSQLGASKMSMVIAMQESKTEASSWYVGSGKSGFFLRGAQVEENPGPTEYIKTEGMPITVENGTEKVKKHFPWKKVLKTQKSAESRIEP